MGRTGWIAGAVLFGLLTGCAEAASETSDPLIIRVLVLDEVGVTANIVHQAKEEASRIFAGIGITLAWLPAGEPPAGSLIVKIAAAPHRQKGKNRNVLGIAAGSKQAPGRIAYLFYHRINDLGEAFGLEVSQMLGHIMAHEMGHLLLPHGSHAVAGLMKGGWDTQQALLASTKGLTFEPSQAALIRARLRER